MKILIVEDDRNMANAIQELLMQEHYLVDACHDGISGEDALQSGEYDAAVLDVMLPGKNGFQIASDARNAGIDTPIMILTAKNDTADKVAGLDYGADDYLTKPFDTSELLARVRALLRRKKQEIRNPDTMEYRDLILDRSTISLTCKGTGASVRLSEKEYHILELFFQNPDQILSKEQFAVRIWGYDNEADYNKVEVYITFVRRKLAFVESKTEIKLQRGFGYQMRDKNA